MALRRTHRLRRGTDITVVLRKGRMISGKLFHLRYLRRNTGPSRFAFVVSQKVVKKSVSRNRLRRRSGEWVRKNAARFSSGTDFVFIFQKGAGDATRQELYRELEALLARL